MIKAVIFLIIAYILKYLFGNNTNKNTKRTIIHSKLNHNSSHINEDVALGNYSDNYYEINEEWESKTLYWSKSYKDGYTYSSKKNAYWRKK